MRKYQIPPPARGPVAAVLRISTLRSIIGSAGLSVSAALIVASVGLIAGVATPAAAAALPASPRGYYLQPALHGETIVFVSEGDLWKVPISGGVATRLTSHPGDESSPAISPDGTMVAFSAQYEGPTELYTMPLSGGLPERLTYSGLGTNPVAWTPDGKILAVSRSHSALPDRRIFKVDPAGGDKAAEVTPIPLSQAADGWMDDDNRTLYFTRFAFQGSHTKRYQGGTAQKIWRYADGDPEATCLTADWNGTSRRPMWWKGRVYFASDRDRTINIWSMDPSGGDLRQHTKHDGWDVASPSLSDGRIVYQLGADLRLLDIASGKDEIVPIALDSDLDQYREHWIEKPMDYVSAVHISNDGEKVVLTARGRVFVAPRKQGRFVTADREEGIRYRDARFFPDGKGLLAMCDRSGEIEFWKLPANGVGEPTQLTDDGKIVRWEGILSPDGKYVAHHDKNQKLYILSVEKKTSRLIDQSDIDNFGDIAWSPDSKWLVYVKSADNMFGMVRLYGIDSGKSTDVTTDRYDSFSPKFSPDGKWIYFLSNRNLESSIHGVWGSYEPEPYFDKMTKIYMIPLARDERSPFAPADELQAASKDAEDSPAKDKDKDKDKAKKSKDDAKSKGKKAEEAKKAEEGEAKDGEEKEAIPPVKIDLDGITSRLIETPVPAGTYSSLMVTGDALYWLSGRRGEPKRALKGAKITNEDFEVKTLLEDVNSVELSGDGKRILVRKDEDVYVIDAAPASVDDLDKTKVDLSAWALSVFPRNEWKQMFEEAWRLERDYFYDPAMHGLDWKGIHDKYAPLVDRVRCRQELSNLLAQMVSELGALHTFVYGGDSRKGEDDVTPASLGAELARDEKAGGYRVARIYKTDPDEPEWASPLARHGVDVKDGDLITKIDGVPVLSVADCGTLLRRKAGGQVLVRIRPAGSGDERDVIVRPITPGEAADLRYSEWEYTRRLEVEKAGEGELGYVHLRAMGGDDFTDWAKNYYPIFTRKGLIVDVRHNGGGNIDSWILSRLMRKAWSFWSQRIGAAPSWNMQYAFLGHVVVLCDEETASDGEEFAEGIRRLGIGKVIGTRTWGGEVWLSSSNSLVDDGIATAAEYGVYGPEGDWLIEGHGVDPDIVVDNLPHATYMGGDAQLDRAVAELKKMIQEKPVVRPAHPKFPDKSGRQKR
jgi:tricorn protease